MSDVLAPTAFACDAPGLGVTLQMTLPRGLGHLLARMLSGWSVDETPTPAPSPDITVSGGHSFRLTSPHYESGKSYTDIVSMLNEVLVALAYACRNTIGGCGLIHAAGFSDGKTNEVVFGKRKAGKSVLTARKAAEGYQIFADDLLLWRDKQREFVALGIAPRLRRPVLPDILETLGAETFIAGTYTCYLVADRIKLAPAGQVLRPDQLLELQPDQSMRRIPLLKIAREISAHRIP